MKAVILAGGRGTRIAEESATKPKPLIEAGGHALIWHIMKNFSLYGVNDFVVLAGYKGHLIKEYFANYWMSDADITFDLSTSNHQVHQARGENWRVTVLDTGLDTMTGGRLAFLRGLIEGPFFLTYGDGVSDVNIDEIWKFHEGESTLATLTAVQPPARFGALNIQGSRVQNFVEKPSGDGAWINGGFFVLEPEVLDFELRKNSVFENDVLPKLAVNGELSAFKYSGFWQPVDTVRDLEKLEEKIIGGALPWLM